MATITEEYRDIVEKIQGLNDRMVDAEDKTRQLGEDQSSIGVWEEIMNDAAEIESMLASSKNKNNPIIREMLKDFQEDTVGPIKMNYKVSLDGQKKWIQGQKDQFQIGEFQDRIKEIDTRLASLKGPKNVIGKAFHDAANKITESFVPSGTEKVLAGEPGKMEDVFTSLAKEKSGLEAATKEVGKKTPTPVI